MGAIGASPIAANISAEQFIGTSLDLALLSDWQLPHMNGYDNPFSCGEIFSTTFIDKGLYTIPEFIEKRYSTNLKTILAIFWIALFVFGNLTTVLFLEVKLLIQLLGMVMVQFHLIALLG